MNKIECIPPVENGKYLLRAFVNSDAPYIIDISRYDDFIAESTEDVLKILDWIERDFLAGDSLHWGIILKKSGELIGNIGFYRGFNNNAGEIGYVLKKGFRNKGIMTELISLLVNFAFNKLELSVVKALVDYDNKASIRVLEKNNFISVDNNGEGYLFYKKNKKGTFK